MVVELTRDILLLIFKEVFITRSRTVRKFLRRRRGTLLFLLLLTTGLWQSLQCVAGLRCLLLHIKFRYYVKVFAFEFLILTGKEFFLFLVDDGVSGKGQALLHIQIIALNSPLQGLLVLQENL